MSDLHYAGCLILLSCLHHLFIPCEISGWFDTFFCNVFVTHARGCQYGMCRAFTVAFVCLPVL